MRSSIRGIASNLLALSSAITAARPGYLSRACRAEQIAAPSALSKRVNKITRCSAHNRICPKSNWHLLAQRVLRLRNADLSPGTQNCARSLLRFIRLVHQKRVVVGMRLGQAQRRHYQRVLMVVLVVALAVTHVHKAVRAIEPLRDLV